MPPEAEAPKIELETADQQSPAIYLGFSSNELDPTSHDYLVRVVQPKLSAISGVQAVPDILGARSSPLLGDSGSKPDRMAGGNGISRSALREALAPTITFRTLGRTKDRWCR